MSELNQDIPYVPPIFEGGAFNCPYCGAYSHQEWFLVSLADLEKSLYFHGDIDNWHVSRCKRCNDHAIWFKEKLIYPEVIQVPKPNQDLNQEIKDDYLEAGLILNKSPRGSVALLRLCVQNLCKQLKEPGKNINDDIGNLVKKGLDEEIQQALDAVRVIGNYAVHPGRMDIKDDQETALVLFDLVNLIAYEMISRKKKVQGVFQKLPQSARDAIIKRDQGNLT